MAIKLRAAWALVSLLGGCMVVPRAAAEHDVYAIGGIAVAGEPARIGMMEVRTGVTKHISLAASIAYFEGAAGYEEMQLRLGATAALEVGRWLVESRNVLSLSTESVERFRYRLRFVRPNVLDKSRLSVRAFDEIFYDFDRSRIVRNNVAVGFGVQLTGALTAELYHVWVDNRAARNDTYMLALLTIRI